MNAELPLLKLTTIINKQVEITTNWLHTIEMMIKQCQMFGKTTVANVQINIQNILD